MSRLRHPIRAIREPFGTAGLVVAVIALVLALTGAAFAAAGLNGKQKKEVEKIAKKYAGKPGKDGAPGAAGKDGTNGTNGAPGEKGANGKSVAVTPIASGGSKCGGRAGAEVKQEGAGTGTPVCEGSPWSAGGTLPSGKTETGVWSVSLPPTESFFEVKVPISFPIPLNEARTTTAGKATAFYFSSEQVANGEFEVENTVTTTMFDSGCRWSLESVALGEPLVKPEATVPGTLCVFSQEETGGLSATPEFGIPGDPFESGFGPAGALMRFSHPSGPGPQIKGAGVWAVTAP